MTQNYPFSITFSNDFFECSQPANGNLVFALPLAEATLGIHSSLPNLFYFGHSGNNICLDYTKSTSPAPGASRKAYLESIIALAGSGGPSVNVNVQNFPANQVVTVSNPVTIANLVNPMPVNETQIGGVSYTLGQKTSANSAPVAISSDQTPIPVSQSTIPWATSVGNFPPSQTINGSVGVSNLLNPMPVTGPIAVTQGTSPWVTQGSATNLLNPHPVTLPANQSVNLTQIAGSGVTLGQKTMANSIPLVISSDQSSIPVSSTVTNFPGTQSVTQGTTPWVVNETQIGGAAYSLAQKTSANSAPVVLASDQSAIPVTGTFFPALQAVNQTQVSGSSITLAQKTSANSYPVVLASDQSSIPVTQGTSPWVISGTAIVGGTVTSNPSIPVSTDLVGASRSTTGTLVTIPIGRTFVGSVSLSCSISVLGNSQPSISVSGAGALPAGTLHQIIAVGLALTTVANSNSMGGVYIYGGTAGATVTFTQGASGTSTGQICGRLL